MVLWRVCFEFLTRWRGKALTPQKRSTVVCQVSHLFPSTSFFTNRSKLVLNFRLLLPKVKLVNFLVYQLISFCHFWWATASFHFFTRRISFGKAPPPRSEAPFLSRGPVSLRVPRGAPGGLPRPRAGNTLRSSRLSCPDVCAHISLTAKDCSYFRECHQRLPCIFLWALLNPHSQVKERTPTTKPITSSNPSSRILHIYPYIHIYIYAYVYWTLPNRTDATLRT